MNKITMYVVNPTFTPAVNYWTIDITDYNDLFIDIKEGINGFDITGTIQTYIKPLVDFKNLRNLVTIMFLQDTILNQ